MTQNEGYYTFSDIIRNTVDFVKSKFILILIGLIMGIGLSVYLNSQPKVYEFDLSIGTPDLEGNLLQAFYENIDQTAEGACLGGLSASNLESVYTEPKTKRAFSQVLISGVVVGKDQGKAITACLVQTGEENNFIGSLLAGIKSGHNHELKELNKQIETGNAFNSAILEKAGQKDSSPETGQFDALEMLERKRTLEMIDPFIGKLNVIQPISFSKSPVNSNLKNYAVGIGLGLFLGILFAILSLGFTKAPKVNETQG